MTLLAGTAGVAAGALVSGADGTPAGLAKGAPTAVITVGAFCGGVILVTVVPPGATLMACWETTNQIKKH